MVGGTVVEVAGVPDRPEVLYLDCVDKPQGRKKADYCAILVERNQDSDRIQVGDSIWWQGKTAYWTPVQNRGGHLTGLKCHVDYDIQIPRVGYSGVEHPSRKVEKSSDV